MLFLGIALLLLSFLTVAKTENVIDVSFALSDGEKYGPYENGTYHHTRVISKSALMGKIVVEGIGMNFTANGYNTQHLKSVFVSQNYSFVINPADDLYTFTFDNSEGNTQCSIRFTLEEKWMDIAMLIPGLVGLLLLPTSLFAFLLHLRKR